MDDEVLTKAWTDGRFLEQLRRTFRITDGQPNILVVDAEMLRRHSVCLRLQDLAAIIDAQPPDQERHHLLALTGTI